MTATATTTEVSRRNFQWLWASTGVSAFGTALTEVALPLVALFVVHVTPLELGLVISFEQLAWLVFGLPAGVWVDRWQRRRVLVLSDLARGLLVAAVPVATYIGVMHLWILLAVSLFTGVCNVFAGVAATAFVPAVVAKTGLVDANSKINATSTASGLSGSAVVGPVVAFLGAPAALLFDAVTYFASSIMISQVRLTESPRREGTTFRREIADGFRIVFQEPLFRVLTLGSAAYNFCVAAQYVAGLTFLRDLGTPKSWFGALLAAAGVGGLAGSMLLPRLTRRWGDATVWRVALVAGPCAGLLVPLAEPGLGLAAYAVGVFGLCAGVAITSIVGFSARQATCPPELLGRVAATTRMITWGVIPVGAALGGWASGALGSRPTLWIVAALFFSEPAIIRATRLWHWTGIGEGSTASGLPEEATDSERSESMGAERSPGPSSTPMTEPAQDG